MKSLKQFPGLKNESLCPSPILLEATAYVTKWVQCFHVQAVCQHRRQNLCPQWIPSLERKLDVFFQQQQVWGRSVVYKYLREMERKEGKGGGPWSRALWRVTCNKCIHVISTMWMSTGILSGPLEKGMANHFSIFALRTPWTVWKGKKDTERWTPQVSRCPIGYWKSVEKYLQKEWRDGDKAINK